MEEFPQLYLRMALKGPTTLSQIKTDLAAHPRIQLTVVTREAMIEVFKTATLTSLDTRTVIEAVTAMTTIGTR